ncbi:MAG TPA: hypothetical protein PK177_04825, partial [Burkholderiaceae bacterium]|nr:hypothetical protein [Burkholderiaceae bacterium]
MALLLARHPGLPIHSAASLQLSAERRSGNGVDLLTETQIRRPHAGATAGGGGRLELARAPAMSSPCKVFHFRHLALCAVLAGRFRGWPDFGSDRGACPDNCKTQSVFACVACGHTENA